MAVAIPAISPPPPPRHNQRVVEGMDEQGAGFLLRLEGRCAGLVEVPPGQHHLGTVIPGGKDLLGRGTLRHKDGCTHPQQVGGKCHPLGVIAGGSGDHPARQGLPRLGGHEVQRAPDLEGAGPLQVFALEREGKAELLAEMVGMDKFGAAHPFLEPVGGFLDQVVGKHGDSVKGIKAMGRDVACNVSTLYVQ